MPATTYTLLVTISHDHGAALSTDLMEVMVQRGLEEGVRDMAGVEAATVSAVEGDYLGVCKIGSSCRRANLAMEKARDLHAALRV